MSKIRETINIYKVLHSDLVSKMSHKKYYYNSTETYLSLLLSSNIKSANKIYWDEILLRAHFASVTSIMRNEKWLTGVELAIETSNYILFASSLRGYLESVTDSYYSLNTPLDLACNFKNVKLAVNGELNRIFVSKELEEKLIHFQHASRSDNSSLPYNKPLYASKYIELFDQHADKNTKELYIKLCEVVHPAQESVSCFVSMVRKSEEYEYAITDTGLDDQYINNILHDYSTELLVLLKMSINAPVVCLNILNLFNYELVKSEYLESCLIYNYINNESWNEILELVEKSYEL